MPRQSISLTEPNDTWLKAQVESKEYSSKSELVNDLIRDARAELKHLEELKSRLDKRMNGRMIDQSPEEMLSEFRERLQKHGVL